MPTAEQIVATIKQYRYPVSAESDFQQMLERVLLANDLSAVREFTLTNGAGRIDFYLPANKIGIELKVKGSPSEVVRQLYRYAQCSEISELILVTGRARLARLPTMMNGKPIYTATCWESLF